MANGVSNSPTQYDTAFCHALKSIRRRKPIMPLLIQSDPATTTTWFSRETVTWMIQAGWIVDGRPGGLILGRTHAEGGGIFMIQGVHDGSDRFVLVKKLVEDGEYLLNVHSYIEGKARIDEINQVKGELPADLVISPVKSECRILNTYAAPFPKLLWIDAGQFVVNAFATSKHLDELESLNTIGNCYFECDPRPFFFPWDTQNKQAGDTNDDTQG